MDYGTCEKCKKKLDFYVMECNRCDRILCYDCNEGKQNNYKQLKKTIKDIYRNDQPLPKGLLYRAIDSYNDQCEDCMGSYSDDEIKFLYNLSKRFYFIHK
jgi:hypothetical protein